LIFHLLYVASCFIEVVFIGADALLSIQICPYRIGGRKERTIYASKRIGIGESTHEFMGIDPMSPIYST